jgi:uncharacterized protein
MRRLLFSVVALIACSCCALAQTQAPHLDPVPESQRASVEEVHALFAAMNSQQQTEQMMQMMKGNMIQAFEEQMAKQSPPPSPHLMNQLRANMNEVWSTLNVNDLMDDLASIYRKYLTRDEIAGIRAFYDSPAGKSMLTKTPGIMNEYMQVALPKEMERMQAAMKQMELRMKKAYDDDAAQNGASSTKPSSKSTRKPSSSPPKKSPSN